MFAFLGRMQVTSAASWFPWPANICWHDFCLWRGRRLPIWMKWMECHGCVRANEEIWDGHFCSLYNAGWSVLCSRHRRNCLKPDAERQEERKRRRPILREARETVEDWMRQAILISVQHPVFITDSYAFYFYSIRFPFRFPFPSVIGNRNIFWCRG